MSTITKSREEIIRGLNDLLRTTFFCGKVNPTAGLAAMGPDFLSRAIQQVQRFNQFVEDNDPYNEHDFGVVWIGEQKIIWKIDYYDKALEYGSEDPADPRKTTRVLTIMLAEEY